MGLYVVSPNLSELVDTTMSVSVSVRIYRRYPSDMTRMELLLRLALLANTASIVFAVNHSSNFSNLTTSFESTRSSTLKVTSNITASNLTSSKSFSRLCTPFQSTGWEPRHSATAFSQISPTITSTSINPYYTHGGPCSAQNASYYEFLQTHTKPLPANYTSPTCCGYCRISATTQVRVTYWPTPALESNITRVTSNGVVLYDLPNPVYRRN